MATIPQALVEQWSSPIQEAVVDVRLRDGTELRGLIADRSGYLFAHYGGPRGEFETCGFDFLSEDIVAVRRHSRFLSWLGLSRWRTV